MAGATNLSDLELEGRGIQAREIDSGEASAGDVLTADGAGGAAWVQRRRAAAVLAPAVSSGWERWARISRR